MKSVSAIPTVGIQVSVSRPATIGSKLERRISGALKSCHSKFRITPLCGVDAHVNVTGQMTVDDGVAAESAATQETVPDRPQCR